MAQDAAPDIVADAIESLPQAHPAYYYVLSAHLLRTNHPDAAVFWFYAGLLRFRLHLTTNPDLRPDGDPALFVSLSETVGAPLYEYAFGDVHELAQTIESVLEWDEQTPNLFTDRSRHAAEWAAVRGGLHEFAQQIVADAGMIRSEREQHGLENR